MAGDGLVVDTLGEEDNFSALFSRAVEEKPVHDRLFADPIELSRDMLKLIKPKPPTYSKRLSSLVPKLRSQFFHGTYLLSPDYLYLAFQMREIADALNTRETMAKHPKIA